jgi:uncharacterized protein
VRALLDVNVLIALLDANHIHHAKARAWMSTNGHLGWSSCAITINGCVRIMSNAAYPNAMPLAEIIARLQEATQQAGHESLDCDISLLDHLRFDPNRLLISSQLTDIYLLGLAVAHQHRLVTFETRISLLAVHGSGSEHLVKI